ncbi:MAG: creatininase family protein [Thermomicrobiales bacterium]
MRTDAVLSRTVELARMTHPEVVLARDEANGVAVIPIGATEQHGPHLPMNTDTISTEVTVLRAARDAGVLAAPIIPYGNSRQNIGFPGTISIRPTILGEFVKDVCHSLVKHGFDKLVVVNGHGGNHHCLAAALEEVHYETGALVALVKCWALASLPAPDGAPAFEGHAGRQETEFMLALAPEDVDASAYVLAPPTVALGAFGSVSPAQYNPFDTPVSFLISTWESTETGHYGDPSMATAERGQLVLDTWATNLAAILRSVKSGEIRITTRSGNMPAH